MVDRDIVTETEIEGRSDQELLALGSPETPVERRRKYSVLGARLSAGTSRCCWASCAEREIRQSDDYVETMCAVNKGQKRLPYPRLEIMREPSTAHYVEIPFQ
jgi:hypothetical protein